MGTVGALHVTDVLEIHAVVLQPRPPMKIAVRSAGSVPRETPERVIMVAPPAAEPVLGLI